jgi:NAD(P)-dependent dehydrogenase (short-subunit alcohol dehydrogenase family)
MQIEASSKAQKWALILGASSGFGAATARALAAKGHNILGIHLDRSSTIHLAREVQEDIEAAGQRALFFNSNAAKAKTRKKVVQALEAEQAQANVLLHSLAFGTLRPFVGAGKDVLTQAQMEMTLDVMAHTLVYWVQDLVEAERLAEEAHIYAMTSSGSLIAFPNYGGVSAAKAALESHVRQLAVELAPRRVAVNAVRAGVTDTPALRKIPGHEQMVKLALERNPYGKLTTPELVAETIAGLIELPYWVTGNIINVDGGEVISGGAYGR